MRTLDHGDVRRTTATFTPDGTKVVSGSSDKVVRIWSADTGELLATLRGHDGGVNDVDVSPDGKLVASASDDATLRIWDIASGDPVATLRGHTEGALCVAFSPDGKHLVSGSADRTLRIWDRDARQEVAVLRGHASEVTCVTYNSRGDRIASGSGDHTLRIWNAERHDLLLTLRGHEGVVTSVDWSLDGNRILTASSDLTVRLWETERASLRMRWRGVAQGARLEPIVERLFEQEIFVDRVVAKLLEDGSLSARARATAIRLARVKGDPSPGELNSSSFAVVEKPGGSVGDYQSALEKAEAASGLEPENAAYMTTLGIALYRLGRYREALDTLVRAERLNEQGNKDLRVHDLLFMAMCHGKLGNQGQAHNLLREARALLTGRTDEERSFLREAEKLLGEP